MLKPGPLAVSIAVILGAIIAWPEDSAVSAAAVRVHGGTVLKVPMEVESDQGDFLRATSCGRLPAGDAAGRTLSYRYCDYHPVMRPCRRFSPRQLFIQRDKMAISDSAANGFAR